MKKNMKELDKTQLEMVNGGSESDIVDGFALVPDTDEIDESEVMTVRQRIPARRLHTRSRSIDITGRRGITVSASRSNPPIHYQ